VIRFFDILFSFVGLIILFPFLTIIALLIKITSKGPIFYKQMRVGISNIDFLVWKFRTMHINADKTGLLTVGGRDPRITTIGYYLRKFKLDELPQLFNVLFGSMSVVGPRPEVRKYVELYTFEQQKVLLVKPGITDWASIVYRDENVVLEKSSNPEHDYIQLILPDKIRYNLIFIEKRSLTEYFKIIITTFWRVIFPVK
jgi:lipopolysaccharide/colanic/teichoic acid biosynthesis glycosyltransferase